MTVAAHGARQGGVPRGETQDDAGPASRQE